MALDPSFKFNLNQVEAKLKDKIDDEMADIAQLAKDGDYDSATQRFVQLGKYIEGWEKNRALFDWLMK